MSTSAQMRLDFEAAMRRKYNLDPAKQLGLEFEFMWLGWKACIEDQESRCPICTSPKIDTPWGPDCPNYLRHDEDNNK